METHFMRLYQRKHKQHKNTGVMKYHQFSYFFPKTIEILLHSKVKKSLESTHFVTSKQIVYHVITIHKQKSRPVIQGVRELNTAEGNKNHYFTLT